MRLRRRRPPTRRRTSRSSPRGAADHRRDRVDREDLLEARHHAVAPGQAGRLADGGDGADGVEEVDQHQREQQRHEPPVERRAHVGLEHACRSAARRRWCRSTPCGPSAAPASADTRDRDEHRAGPAERQQAGAGDEPTIAISGPGADQSPAVTGGSVSPGCSDSAATVDAGTTTICAWTRPRKMMNRPMPTPMARRRSTGMARVTASRSPSRTQARTMSAVEHDEAHRALPAAGRRRDLERDEGVQPHPRRQRDRHVRAQPHQDRGQAGGQRRGGDGGVPGTPAADRIDGLATRM